MVRELYRTPSVRGTQDFTLNPNCGVKGGALLCVHGEGLDDGGGGRTHA